MISHALVVLVEEFRYTFVDKYTYIYYNRVGCISVVALLDMDAFFAMIECRRNTFLLDKPVAIIGWGKRTAVSSVNYLAKKCGVKVGMAPQMARKICPNIVLVKADFAEYESISMGIENIIDREFPRYIRYSIDEFFIDLNIPHSFEKLHRVKADIRRRYGLTCSIGVAANPVLSKIACEMSKPDGFLIVQKDQISTFLEKLEVSVIPGIGVKTQSYLQKMSIYSVKELVEFVRKGFGCRTLNELVDSLFAEDFDRKEFFKKKPPKSFGHMKTLDVNVSDLVTLKEIGFYLLYRSFLRMVREGYSAKTISLILKYAKSGNISCSKTLKDWCSDFTKLSKVVEMLLEGMFNGEPVRMLGVSLSNLKLCASNQLELFSNPEKFLKAVSVKNLEISSRLFLKKVASNA